MQKRFVLRREWISLIRHFYQKRRLAMNDIQSLKHTVWDCKAVISG
jgi:hypothetical protein